jgi:hypothetical protein
MVEFAASADFPMSEIAWELPTGGMCDCRTSGRSEPIDLPLPDQVPHSIAAPNSVRIGCFHEPAPRWRDRRESRPRAFMPYWGDDNTDPVQSVDLTPLSVTSLFVILSRERSDRTKYHFPVNACIASGSRSIVRIIGFIVARDGSLQRIPDPSQFERINGKPVQPSPVRVSDSVSSSTRRILLSLREQTPAPIAKPSSCDSRDARTTDPAVPASGANALRSDRAPIPDQKSVYRPTDHYRTLPRTPAVPPNLEFHRSQCILAGDPTTLEDGTATKM